MFNRFMMCARVGFLRLNGIVRIKHDPIAIDVIIIIENIIQKY